MSETVSAAKKLGRAEASALMARADTIIVAKGRDVQRITRRTRPDDETLIALLLGPTGNLRAPTIVAGRTLLVGFDETAYRDTLAT